MKKQNEIILISPAGKTRGFRLPVFFHTAVSACAVFLFLSCLSFGLLCLARGTIRLMSTWSIHRSEILSHRFQNMVSYTASVEARMDALFSADDERRVVTGAKPIQSEIREVGIGGPSTLADFERLFLFQDELERKALEDRLDKLNRQSDFQIHSLSEFEDFFSQKLDIINHIPAVQPAEGAFLSGFGMRFHPILHTRRMHKGVDISNSIGTPVLASAAATVQTGVSESFGTYVLLNHQNGFSTLYAHLSSSVVRDKERVERGQIIGYLGNSGLSTGPHLHYEVHLDCIPVDPEPYLLPENYIVD